VELHAVYLELSEMLQTTYSLTQVLLCRIDLKPDFETFVNDQEELVLQPSQFSYGWSPSTVLLELSLWKPKTFPLKKLSTSGL